MSIIIFTPPSLIALAASLPPSHLEEMVASPVFSMYDDKYFQPLLDKICLTETAFLAALRGGRAGVSVAQVRPEDEGTVEDCVAARGDGWGSEAVPAPPHPAAGIEATPPARPTSSMLGAAYQVRAESLSLAVSAHYRTHPSRSPVCPACPQLCLC